MKSSQAQRLRPIHVAALVGAASVLGACKARNDALGRVKDDTAAGGGASVGLAWDAPDGTVAGRHFGHNSVWSRGGLGIWDEQTGTAKPDVLEKIGSMLPPAGAARGQDTAARTVLRFPGGTRAMKYHFAKAIGPTAQREAQCDAFTGTVDRTTYGLDEFLQHVAAPLNADVSLVTSWVTGSAQEAGAMVAYTNGDPASAVELGVDASGVNWGTVGSWAQKRAANGHPEKYAAIKYVEIGNEQYLSLPVPKLSNCGRFGLFHQNQQYVGNRTVETTAAVYAAEVVKTAALIRAIDPGLKIGASSLGEYMIDSDAATVVGPADRDDPWNKRLVDDAADAFDFFIIHPYDLGTNSGNRPSLVPVVPRVAQLAAAARKTIRQLRALAPTKEVAMTEFGAFSYGDRFANGLIAAAITEVALEEQALMSLRHILIEDQPGGFFAAAAAVLGPTHALTPGYHVMQLLGAYLSGKVVKAGVDDPNLLVLGTIDQVSGKAAVLVVNLAESGAGVLKTLNLPTGAWHAKLHQLSADDPLALAEAMHRIDAELGSVSGTLSVTAPPLSVSVVELAP